MDDSPILICYDGSKGARNAIFAAAALLVSRAAVIVNVGPLALVAEVSHEVAEHARRPVLVVPPNEPPLS